MDLLPPWALTLIQVLGLPGLIFFIWYGDLVKFRRMEDVREKERASMMEMLNKTLAQYKDDVTEIKHLYQNNARLCDDWCQAYKHLEKLYYETMQVVSLNTQTMSRMVDRLDNHCREFDRFKDKL